MYTPRYFVDSISFTFDQHYPSNLKLSFPSRPQKNQHAGPSSARQSAARSKGQDFPHTLTNCRSKAVPSFRTGNGGGGGCHLPPWNRRLLWRMQDKLQGRQILLSSQQRRMARGLRKNGGVGGNVTAPLSPALASSGSLPHSALKGGHAKGPPVHQHAPKGVREVPMQQFQKVKSILTGDSLSGFSRY